MASGRIKPKVGIVFSQTDRFSGESLNLANYFCGLLSASGYSEIFMIGFESDGMPGEVCPRRVKYITRGTNTPKEVPVSDVTFAHFHALQDCHLIVVTVNSNDTKACCAKLIETVANPKVIPVFSLQRGVRNSATCKDELEGKGFTVIEGVVGFAVLPDPRHGAAVASLPRPGILFERLTKEAVKVADGPLRLLERMDVDVSFRKVLTPQSWGVLVFENLYVLNILTKGSLRDTLANREWRLVLALMVRESYKMLDVAAKGGKWKPDLLLVHGSLTPWALEMCLAMPDALFYLAFWFLRLLPEPNLISPGQLDIIEGRKSMLDWHFAELVQAAERHAYDAPVCSLVLKQLRQIENTLFPELAGLASAAAAGAPDSDGREAEISGTGDPIHRAGGPALHSKGRGAGGYGGVASSPSRAAVVSGGSIAVSYNNTDHMAALMAALSGVDGAKPGCSVVEGHPTLGEWWYWVSRCLAVAASIALVLFLFLHDY